MIPDEVVKGLDSILRLDYCIGTKNEQVLTSAISLIQDYQKLRERVSVENISQVIKESEKQWRREHTIDTEENIAEKIEEVELSKEYLKHQSEQIVIYLGGGE